MFNWLRRMFTGKPVEAPEEIYYPSPRVSVARPITSTLKTAREWEREGRRVDHESRHSNLRDYNGDRLYSMDTTLPLLLLAGAALADNTPAAEATPVQEAYAATISGSGESGLGTTISAEDTERNNNRAAYTPAVDSTIGGHSHVDSTPSYSPSSDSGSSSCSDSGSSSSDSGSSGGSCGGGE